MPYLYLTGSFDCFEWNTNFNGNDLDLSPVKNVDSKHECQKLCQETTGCEFFTYDPNAYNPKMCYLKTSDGGRITGLTAKGIVSGPKFCGKQNNKKKEKYFVKKLYPNLLVFIDSSM